MNIIRKIIFLGKPASGKGTQAKLLSEALDIEHISVGDLVRTVLQSASHPLKQKILEYKRVKKWEPLPDEIACELVLPILENRESWILDGFPRNVEQANMLNFHPDFVFLLQISDEESRSRVVLRKREDDSLENSNERLRIEQSRLPQMIEYYRSQVNLVELDGTKTIESIHQTIINHTKGVIE